MAVDLSGTPWNRLAKLAPPATPTDELQEAADRWALTGDIYNAAADLWEERALAVDVSVAEAADPISPTGTVQSVSQDGISVTYASDALAGNGLSARVASSGQMWAMVRRLRAKGRPKSVLMHDDDYDAWSGTFPADPENIIVVDEV